ncbi:MAG: hypothetical protein ACRDHN_05710 [Thermomicrobiales bacterium]
MTDGDPFGRRGGRRPEDRDYSQPWNDEGALDDPYSDPTPPDTRRARSARQPRGNDPQQQPYPYRQQDQRYPGDEQDPNWERGGSQQQPAWPDRPYANQPQQRPQPQGQYAQQPQYDDYDERDGANGVGEWEERQREPRRGRDAEQRPRVPRQPLPRPSIPPALSAAIAGQDSRLLLIVAGSFISLVLMAIVTFTRVDAMNGWFPLHIDASGAATKWGNDGALWRLPFGLAILTVMNIASAFVLSLREQRIVWILIGSLPLIHVVAWIALILIGW